MHNKMMPSNLTRKIIKRKNTNWVRYFYIAFRTHRNDNSKYRKLYAAVYQNTVARI